MLALPRSDVSCRLACLAACEWMLRMPFASVRCTSNVAHPRERRRGMSSAGAPDAALDWHRLF